MSLQDWIYESKERWKENGISSLKESVYQFYVGIWRMFGRNIYNYGENVYDREWDVLIVLDACRWDLMEEVMDEYKFLTENQKFNSVASTSSEWLEKTFNHKEETQKTSYISGNLFTEQELNPREFNHLDEVWGDTWNDEKGTILPDSLTDRAIEHHRNENPTRMVVHYMQPHHPFVSDMVGEGMSQSDETSTSPWNLLRCGKLNRDQVWKRYTENLRYVLNDVEILLENIDSENVVITADHGNLLGEFGLYGHIGHTPVSPVKEVPWIETKAENLETHTPEIFSEETGKIHEKLEDLGYV